MKRISEVQVKVGSEIRIVNQSGGQLAQWRVSEVDGREVTLVCSHRSNDRYPHTRMVMVGVTFHDGPAVRARFSELGNGCLALRMSLNEGLAAHVGECEIESHDRLD